MKLKQSDKDIVRQCRSGDTGAFADLVERYEKKIFVLSRRMVRDYDDARDITQMTFVKAYEKLGTYDLTQKFFSWLYRIAINEAINHLRSQKDRATYDDALSDGGPTPEQEYVSAELRRKVDAAMLGLDVSSRALVVLRHYADLSYQELGYVFGTSANTIKSRLYGARRSLEEGLKDRGITSGSDNSSDDQPSASV